MNSLLNLFLQTNVVHSSPLQHLPNTEHLICYSWGMTCCLKETQYVARPPVASQQKPVVNPASSLAANATNAAISSILPHRFLMLSFVYG